MRRLSVTVSSASVLEVARQNHHPKLGAAVPACKPKGAPVPRAFATVEKKKDPKPLTGFGLPAGRMKKDAGFALLALIGRRVRWAF
jgi:hypothetical protein